MHQSAQVLCVLHYSGGPTDAVASRTGKTSVEPVGCQIPYDILLAPANRDRTLAMVELNRELSWVVTDRAFATTCPLWVKLGTSPDSYRIAGVWSLGSGQASFRDKVARSLLNTLLAEDLVDS